MKILFKNIQVHFPNGQQKVLDIEIADGLINRLGTIEKSDHDEVVENKNWHCSVGWFDPFVNFCEPGLEYKEDLESGMKVAAAGGFTEVGVLPDTIPLMSTRPQVDFVLQKTRNSVVDCWPLASFIKENSDSELSEMAELSEAKILAFKTAEGKGYARSVILKAMEYSIITGKKVVLDVTDRDLIPGSYVHEGKANLFMGMKGIPDFSEELLVRTYIELAKYSGAKVHLSGITSEKSLSVIEAAVETGLEVTFDVSINNLCFTEENLASFDSNYKFYQPLRAELDRKALKKAAKLGKINCISSFHAPQDIESKKCELPQADFGSIGLQTFFPVLVTELGLSDAISFLSRKNREAFNLDLPEIEMGKKANLTFFDPNETWVLDQSTNLSKSSNTPWMDKTMKGKVKAVVNGAYLQIMDPL